MVSVELVDQDWVDNLKEGDLVAIDEGGSRSTHYIITSIVKITPTRLIKTSNGKTFKKDGWQRVSSSWDRPTYLQPVTSKIQEHVERRELLSEIKHESFEDFSTQALREFKELIARLRDTLE